MICQISRWRTVRFGTSPRCSYTQLMTLSEPNALKPRNTAVLMESSQITALVNGGKLSVISLPVLRIKVASSNLHCLTNRGLMLWQRHHGQASVTLQVDRLDRKNYVIFGKLHGGAQSISNRLRMFPFGSGGSSPQDFIGASTRRGLPREGGIILQIGG